MSDEVSGELTLAFDMLQVDAEHLDGVFDCRAPICANEENALKVARHVWQRKASNCWLSI